MKDKECLSPELNELVSGYYLGELTETQREKFEQHMLECDPCFQQLDELDLIIKTLKSDREYITSHFLTPKDLTDLKNAFQTRSEIKKTSLFPKLVYVVSLVLFVASLFFIYKTFKLQGEFLRERAENEQLNKKLIELAEQNRQREMQVSALEARLKETGPIYANTSSYILNVSALRSDEAQSLKIPKESQIINFVISFQEKKAYRLYRVEIRDVSGALLLQSDHLKKDKYNNLQLAIAKNALKAKEYVMKIYGVIDAKYDLITEHRFRMLL